MQIVIWGIASIVLLVTATLIAAAIDRRAGWDRVPVVEPERAPERRYDAAATGGSAGAA